MGLIESLFHSSLIQLVVEIGGYFDEVGHVADASGITHDLVLRCHECGIVPLGKVGILLEPGCIICC